MSLRSDVKEFLESTLKENSRVRYRRVRALFFESVPEMEWERLSEELQDYTLAAFIKDAQGEWGPQSDQGPSYVRRELPPREEVEERSGGQKCEETFSSERWPDGSVIGYPSDRRPPTSKSTTDIELLRSRCHFPKRCADLWLHIAVASGAQLQHSRRRCESLAIVDQFQLSRLFPGFFCFARFCSSDCNHALH